MFNHCLSRNPRVLQSVQYLTGRTRSGGNSKIAQERGLFDLHLPPPAAAAGIKLSNKSNFATFCFSPFNSFKLFRQKRSREMNRFKKVQCTIYRPQGVSFNLLIHGHLKLCFLNIPIFAARFYLILKQSWFASVTVLPYSTVQYIGEAPSRFFTYIWTSREKRNIHSKAMSEGIPYWSKPIWILFFTSGVS